MQHRILASTIAIFTVTIATAIPARSATFTLNTQQANADANHWNAPIWQPGSVSPTPGNTYEVLVGGRVRSPNGTVASGGTATDGQTFTFPGDALQLDGVGFNATNGSGELRLKSNFNNATFNFPGAGGNPGLILNGGIINNGEDRIMTISGSVRAVPSTISSINPGGGAVTDIGPLRAFLISASITGSGGLTLDYAHDSDVTVPAVQINSSNPNFTGDWTVNSGWLKGTATNSLGLGNITLTSLQGPSTLDFDYNATNPTGNLTLTGSTSKLVLDQNLTFRSVTINGTSLTAGPHTFAELNAAFDSNIVDGGTGIITVIPEPSATALIGVFGVLLSMRRRRSV